MAEERPSLVREEGRWRMADSRREEPRLRHRITALTLLALTGVAFLLPVRGDEAGNRKAIVRVDGWQ